MSITKPKRPGADDFIVAFDHHKLDVYRRALDALDACDSICDELPSRRRHVNDQIERAATSVIANTAEGAGEFSPAEKARFYRMARRSAIEVVAWLEITQRRGEAPSQLIDDALAHLEAVVSMLVRLIKRATK